jgi:hypothetical protein
MQMHYAGLRRRGGPIGPLGETSSGEDGDNAQAFGCQVFMLKHSRAAR